MRLLYPWSTLLVLTCCLLFHTSSFAATIVVTSTADNGAGTLRQAVMDATPGDDIVFASSTDGNLILLTSEIAIGKSLTITGNGEGQTMISGGKQTRIFNVSATVEIGSLSIRDGQASDSGGGIINTGDLSLDQVSITDSRASGGMPSQGGGAIANSGQLTVTNSTISSNRASGASGSGGAIINSPGGLLTISGSTFRDNVANRAGGAIEDASGAATLVTITETNILNNVVNTSPGNGGGIHVGSDGDVSISGGSVSGNRAGQEGGGLWNGAGTMTVSDVLVRNNVASGDDAMMGAAASSIMGVVPSPLPTAHGYSPTAQPVQPAAGEESSIMSMLP